MCRYMFNTFLSIVLDNFSKYNTEVEWCLKNKVDFDESKFNKSHKLPKISVIKKTNEDYAKVDSLALCAEYSNLVRGMEMFYRGHCKRPRFKSRNDKHSYTTSQVNNNIRIVGRKLDFLKLDLLKLEGCVKFLTISKLKELLFLNTKKVNFIFLLCLNMMKNLKKMIIIN